MSTLGFLRGRQTDGSDRSRPDADPTSSTYTTVASPLRTHSEGVAPIRGKRFPHQIANSQLIARILEGHHVMGIARNGFGILAGGKQILTQIQDGDVAMMRVFGKQIQHPFCCCHLPPSNRPRSTPRPMVGTRCSSRQSGEALCESGCLVSSEVRNQVARPRSNNEGQAESPIGNSARALPTTETQNTSCHTPTVQLPRYWRVCET